MAGRKITDFGGEPHTSEMMMKSKNKVKSFSSAEGAGAIGMDYPDTTEAIHRDQDHGHGKIKSKPMKPGYRY
jgi:hypothetical protein